MSTQEALTQRLGGMLAALNVLHDSTLDKGEATEEIEGMAAQIRGEISRLRRQEEKLLQQHEIALDTQP